MKIKSFKPLDENCYHMEECVYDTYTGKGKTTGRKYRKISDYIPKGEDAYKAFAEKMKRKGYIVLYNPKSLIPCAYKPIKG